MTDTRPDLPALEEVHSTSSHRSMCAAALVGWAGLGSFLAHLALTYQEHAGEQLPVLLAGMTLYGLVGLWPLWRLLFTDYEWKTDAEGLSTRSVLRRRRLRWADAQASTCRENLIDHGEYRLRSPQGDFNLPSASRSLSRPEAQLAASCWQHLRRFGKAEGFTLSPSADSLWDTIPDTAGVVRWVNQKPPNPRWERRKWPAAWLALAAVTALLWCVDPQHRLHDVLIIAGLYGGILGMWQALERRETWKRVLGAEASDAGLSVERTDGLREIRWSEVRDAEWRMGDASGTSPANDIVPCLRIHVTHEDLVLPWQRRDAASGRLILSVIRHLRSSPAAFLVPVPEGLRLQALPAAPAAPGDGCSRVELRWSVPERCGLLLPSTLGLAMMGLPLTTPDAGAGFLALGLLILLATLYGWWHAGKHRLIADETGLTLQSAHGSRSWSWRAITRCEPPPDRWRETGSVTLYGAGDSRLSGITLPPGRPADWARLQAVVQQHAAPGVQTPDTSWLSRPWQPCAAESGRVSGARRLT